MAERFTNPVPQYLDSQGSTLAGAKVYFYESSTSTPLDTFSDEALTVANLNPVICDGDGRLPNTFLQDAQYKVRMDTAADVTIWERDPVAPTADVINDVTFSDLKAINVTLLTEGQTVYVNGRTTSGDGGEGHFKYTQSNPGAGNDGTILHSDTVGNFFVRQDIFWFNVKWFGATGDDSTDDTTSIQNCINATAASSTVNHGVIFPAGTYRVTTLAFKNASSSAIYGYKSHGGAIIKGTSSTGDVILIAADRVHMSDIDVTSHTTRTISGNGVQVNGDNCTLTRVKASDQPGIGISVTGTGTTIDNPVCVENDGTSEVQVDGNGHTIISPSLTRAATGSGTCLEVRGDQQTVIGGEYLNSNIGINVIGSVCNIISPQFTGDSGTPMATGINFAATATNNTVTGLEATYTDVTNALVVHASSTGNTTTQDGDTIHYGGLRADEGLELSDGGPTITEGTGDPEGVKTAPQGSAFLRTDGTTPTTIYSKISGAGDTGWQAMAPLVKHPTVYTGATGLTLTWTGIPSGVQAIKIVFAGASSDGATDQMLCNLGDAGGIENTGYVGRITDTGGGVTWGTGAQLTKGISSGETFDGTIYIDNITGNQWSIGLNSEPSSGSTMGAKGSKTLSAELTQIELEWDAAADFDEGNFALYYQ